MKKIVLLRWTFDLLATNSSAEFLELTDILYSLDYTPAEMMVSLNGGRGSYMMHIILQQFRYPVIWCDIVAPPEYDK